LVGPYGGRLVVLSLLGCREAMNSWSVPATGGDVTAMALCFGGWGSRSHPWRCREGANLCLVAGSVAGPGVALVATTVSLLCLDVAAVRSYLG
jgi:hypothetical protein